MVIQMVVFFKTINNSDFLDQKTTLAHNQLQVKCLAIKQTADFSGQVSEVTLKRQQIQAHDGFQHFLPLNDSKKNNIRKQRKKVLGRDKKNEIQRNSQEQNSTQYLDIKEQKQSYADRKQ